MEQAAGPGGRRFAARFFSEADQKVRAPRAPPRCGGVLYMQMTWRRCGPSQLQHGTLLNLCTFSGCADLLVRCRRRRPETCAGR